jgi:hypothetical protein
MAVEISSGGLDGDTIIDVPSVRKPEIWESTDNKVNCITGIKYFIQFLIELEDNRL